MAADIHERLPAQSRDGYEIALSQSLSALADALYREGELGQAVVAAELAADVYRRLADTDDQFRIKYTEKLGRLAARQLLAAQLDAARLDNALETIHEALGTEPDRDGGIWDRIYEIGTMMVGILQSRNRPEEADMLRQRLNAKS